VVAQLTLRGSDPGSIVALRLARTRFQSAFISLFAVVALGGPVAVLFLEISWPSAKLPWWSFLEGLLQDAAIYAGCMALNTALVRRDAAFVVDKVAELVRATTLVEKTLGADAGPG
jgi:hypothetical protein